MRSKPSLDVRLALFATLLVALWAAAPAADAARLTEVSRHEVHLENGEPVEPAPGPRRITAAATGAGSTSQLNIFSILNPDEPEPAVGFQTSETNISFLIEPEDGESIGDCVLVDYEFAATGSVTASGGADARVGVGGGMTDVETDPVSVSFEGPTQIVLDTGAGQEVQLSAGPVVIAPGDPDIALAEVGSFVARIGDEVQLLLSSGTAWNVPQNGQASGRTDAELSAEVRPGLVACPAPSVVEVPTLDQWGLGGLALLLAGVGFVILVRRRLI